MLLVLARLAPPGWALAEESAPPATEALQRPRVLLIRGEHVRRRDANRIERGLAHSFDVVDGAMAVPTGAGIGVEIDEERIEALTEREAEFA